MARSSPPPRLRCPRLALAAPSAGRVARRRGAQRSASEAVRSSKGRLATSRGGVSPLAPLRGAIVRDTSRCGRCRAQRVDPAGQPALATTAASAGPAGRCAADTDVASSTHPVAERAGPPPPVHSRPAPRPRVPGLSTASPSTRCRCRLRVPGFPSPCDEQRAVISRSVGEIGTTRHLLWGG